MFDEPLPADSGESSEAARPASNDQIAAEITRAAGHLNALNYKFIKLLDAFDRNEGWAGDGIKSFAHWLNWQCGIGDVEAREKVRVARALRELPGIDNAFREGRLSYTKVRAVTRVATPDNETYLLELADHGTAAHVEKLVRQYRRCRSLAEDDPSSHVNRFFNCYQDEDGMVVLNGRLFAEEGELLMCALRKLMEHGWRKQHQEQTKECGLQAENVSAETSSRRPSMADAVAKMAEHCLATALDTEDGELQTLSAPDRHQLVVFVNVNEASRDCQIEDGPALTTSSGQFMHPAVVKRLACDATLRPVGVNDEDDVLSVGRKTRTIPPHLRLALERRDGGCRFPGCSQTRHTDGHHIVHWADGGETRLDNLVSLCRFHHTRLHLGHFEVDLEDGEPIFVDSRGQAIPSVMRFDSDKSPGHDILDLLDRRWASDGINIDASTAVTKWEGESMDYDIALDALADLEAPTPPT